MSTTQSAIATDYRSFLKNLPRRHFGLTGSVSNSATLETSNDAHPNDAEEAAIYAAWDAERIAAQEVNFIPMPSGASGEWTYASLSMTTDAEYRR